jgi:hypothetical protein
MEPGTVSTYLMTRALCSKLADSAVSPKDSGCGLSGQAASLLRLPPVSHACVWAFEWLQQHLFSLTESDQFQWRTSALPCPTTEQLWAFPLELDLVQSGPEHSVSEEPRNKGPLSSAGGLLWFQLLCRVGGIWREHRPQSARAGVKSSPLAPEGSVSLSD